MYLSAVPGFRVGSLAAKLKPSGRPDLACIVSELPCTAAGVFTTNKFQAAPVQLCKSILSSDRHNVLGVLINSGQANACTGTQGLQDAYDMASAFEGQFAGRIGAKGAKGLIMSTGIIGQRVNMSRLTRGVQGMELGGDYADWEKLARAVMTTDTVHKMFYKREDQFSMIGVAKGSGMIHPNMATMLGVLCTDAYVTPECLDSALRYCVERSFNCIDVDGDTSTNDTVLVLANGVRKDEFKVDSEDSPEYVAFRDALLEASIDLAKKVVKDGEGATKLVTIIVEGASTRTDAVKVAKSIAQSSLVKCAMFGNDPNWGRILCAVGYSGVDVEPTKVDLFLETEVEEKKQASFKATEKVQIVSKGEPISPAPKAAAEKVVGGKSIVVRVCLGLGDESATVWGTDLSYDYVRINAEYTT
eukprot:TRINITY_DN11207_c0_g1_i2.p1 TRINITY_DN11207_c0_g1~~TRINITY_DN11207_c0_g1_i2.p1  ORF type:complete len:416 (+),score=106.76 TRINITY_DN11207_c0_g1_i2:42-1289(+)